MIDLIDLKALATLVPIAVGLALVITCTKATYPLRVAWAFVFRPKWLRWTWKLVMCPHCNSWWSGGAIALLTGFHWSQALQVAFTTCGIVYMLQRVLQRDVGFMLYRVGEMKERWVGQTEGVSLEPDEDFEDLLGLEE